MKKKIIEVTKSKKILEVLTDAGFSYAAANKILRNKDVKVDGQRVKDNIKVDVGAEVLVFYQEETKNYEVVYQDDEILVINKFTNVEVGDELAKELNAFAVHRLDRNTQGLVIFAKTKESKQKLDKAIKAHKIRKAYLTEVVGKFEANGQYAAYLQKDEEKSLVKVSKQKLENSVKIETYIKTLKKGEESSLLEVEITGGKTHQIRAHLAYLGHAIIGDGKYGRREDYKRFGEKYQKLFAYKLIFGNIGLKVDGREIKIYPKWIDEEKLKALIKESK